MKNIKSAQSQQHGTQAHNQVDWKSALRDAAGREAHKLKIPEMNIHSLHTHVVEGWTVVAYIKRHGEKKEKERADLTAHARLKSPSPGFEFGRTGTYRVLGPTPATFQVE